MFKVLRNAWAVPDIRKKILFTLFMLLIYRLGSHIPVPFLDPTMMARFVEGSAGNGLFGLVDSFTGGAFSQATIFAMGITPYINSSIILQLLTIAIPALERMAKEGPEGRKKITSITRYTTIGLALIQAIAICVTLNNWGLTQGHSFLNLSLIHIFEKLFVAEVYANEGPTLKRIRARAKGSAARIRKRTSHISIVLREKD